MDFLVKGQRPSKSLLLLLWKFLKIDKMLLKLLNLYKKMKHELLIWFTRNTDGYLDYDFSLLN